MIRACRSLRVVCACAPFAAAPLAAQQAPHARLDTIPVASVDFYGLRTISDSVARQALRIPTGVRVPGAAARAAAIARVEALPGVRHATIDAVCCATAGGIMLYVGVVESGAPTMHFDPPPGGASRLPAPVSAAGVAFDRAFEDAIAHGDFAESDSAGHALMHWPAARAVQIQFVDLAARYAPELRNVLQHSGDAGQRALAAQVLAYSADKAAVVGDLATALRDPDATVRNNATRALAVIAMFAHLHPRLGIHVPYAPLVAMLDSPVWTDRNKSSLALAQITASRDPALFALLRARALPALTEMARWFNLSHAGPALAILGRLAGMSDAAIYSTLQRGDRAPILDAAKRIAPR